jgi:4'-phosphopantetheinyl transferase EntD
MRVTPAQANSVPAHRDRQLLAGILPSCVASQEAYAARCLHATFAQEKSATARAVPSRKRAFLTGRACARHALDALGKPTGGIAVEVDGTPCWPPGVIGSITHTDDYVAAAVARAEQVSLLGIDVEPNLRLPRGLLGRLTVPDERVHLNRLAHSERGVAWDRLQFSAKECGYKALYPLAQVPATITQVHVTLEADGTFTASWRPSNATLDGPCPDCVAGRWAASDKFLVTAVAEVSLAATGRSR